MIYGHSHLRSLLFATLLCLMGWTEAWAQTTSYVLTNTGNTEVTVMDRWSQDQKVTYTLTGPGHTISVSHKKQWSATKDITVNCYSTTDGSGNVVYTKSLSSSTSYKTTTIDISAYPTIRSIVFNGEGTERKYIRNVSVTRATTLSTSTTSLDFGTQHIGISSTRSASIDFNNTTYNQQVTGTCSDSHFTVTHKKVGETGSTAIDITYTSTTPGIHSGTVTLSMNGKQVSFPVSGASQATYNFSAQASPNNSAYGSATATVDASITSTNTTESKTATFTATANEGYELAGWGTTADATTYESTANPYTATITNSAPESTATKTLYAIFRPVFYFTATAERIHDYGTATATVADKVLGEPTGTSVSTQVTFTATTNDNCTFEGWYADKEHTQLVSKEANYTHTITNNQMGSTAGLTLYAWFKTNQTLDWSTAINDFNLVNGTTADCAATSSSGLPVTYKSSNNIVASVDDNGLVTANAASNDGVVVTAMQPGDDRYNAAPDITRTFFVLEKLQASFIVSGFTGTNPTIKLGDTPTITVSNFDGDFTYTSSAPDVVGISMAGNVVTLTALKAGTSTVTLSQPANTTHNASAAVYDITVDKFANTLEVSIEAMEAKVDGTIAVALSGQNNTEAPILCNVVEQSLSSPVSSGTDVISYENGIITARNAGTAKITFTQAATDTYEEYASATYEITVTKHHNPISISLNGSTVPTIRLKYGESATLEYSSANTGTQCTVIRTAGEHTTISGNTITAGTTAGTDLYEITQAETYKYEAGYASFSIKVNNTNEAVGYVLYDETQYSHGTGAGVVHTYELTGPGETLYYSARKSSGATIYYHLYVEYSSDNANWTQAQDNESLTSSYQQFSCAIPETARYVRFRFPGGGTLTKYISDVKVPRKTYLRASSDKTALGTLYTDQTAQATFTVDYSTTNGGNIQLNSNNANFTVSQTELETSGNSDGTKTFTVTYTPNPDQLGEESAVITMADLFYSQEITLTATAAKYGNTLAMSLDKSELKVEETANVTFTGKNSYGAITASYSVDGIVGYDNGAITALNAGSTRITLTQAATATHLSTRQSFDIVVSKHDQTLAWDNILTGDDLTLSVGQTLDSNTATASSGLAVTYSSANPAVITVDGHTGLLTAISDGANVEITATQPGNYKYNEASITRRFSVSSKMEATVITTLSTEGTNELTVGEGDVTIGCNAALTAENFSISGNAEGIILVSFAGNTLTVTPSRAGEVTITLDRPEDDNYHAIHLIYNIKVTGATAVLHPDEEPALGNLYYSGITLERNFRAGYSTLSLPFTTTVSQLAGESYDAANDWLAQLSIVTYNAQDGYTLYFRKLNDGIIRANEPYILHLTTAVENPVFHDVTAEDAIPGEHAATGGMDSDVASYREWTMKSNYTPHMSMYGMYGITGNCLMLGGPGSTLNAYTAYIMPPAAAQARVRIALQDEDGNTTAIISVREANDGSAPATYDLNGVRSRHTQPGVHIVIDSDGTARKVLK